MVFVRSTAGQIDKNSDTCYDQHLLDNHLERGVLRSLAHARAAVIRDWITQFIMDASTNPSSGFNSLGLSPQIQSALASLKFSQATPIQAKSIPIALTGVDLIGLAQTGTGKTLAFGLPVIERLLSNSSQRALIIVPTRELALQVQESLNNVIRRLNTNLRSIVLIGGMPIYRQIKDLKSRPQLIVATPGRLRDHLEQKNIDLAAVSILVLDEADRMLDMGFAPQIKYICDRVPESRQTMLFSATMAPEVAELARSFQNNPTRVEIASTDRSASLIKQELCYVEHHGKTDLLIKLLNQHAGTVLVFSRTKHGARKLSDKVNDQGHRSIDIHSNKSLSQRRQALEGFKTGRYRVLVATDVASRGIDVHNIELVINYDLPDATEDYIHRIGRTGRAGQDGHAISFATPDQKRDVSNIERLVGRAIPLSNLSMAVPTAYRPSYSGRSTRPNQFGRPNRSWHNGR